MDLYWLSNIHIFLSMIASNGEQSLLVVTELAVSGTKCIVINYWTTRMNILCGNSLGSKTNEDVRMYTSRTFILVAFHVVCTTSGDELF